MRDPTLLQLNVTSDPKEPARLATRENRMPQEDELPATIFEQYRDAPLTELPSFFVGGATIAFERELAGPLLTNDLGLTFVLPLQVLDYERKKQLFTERNYHCIFRHNVFRALAPEHSPRLVASVHYPNAPLQIPMKPRPGKPHIPDIEDGDVAVHAKALEGPLTWYDDQLSGCIFFRGDLVEEMEDAGVAKYWQLKKCKIVP